GAILEDMLQLPPDGQPQAHAILQGAGRVAQLGERFTYARLILAGVVAADMLHLDTRLVLAFTDAPEYRAGSGVHQGIGQVVAHQRLQQQRVGEYGAAGRALEADLDAALSGRAVQTADKAPQPVVQVQVPQLRPHHAHRQPADVQQRVEHGLQQL